MLKLYKNNKRKNMQKRNELKRAKVPGGKRCRTKGYDKKCSLEIAGNIIKIIVNVKKGIVTHQGVVCNKPFKVFIATGFV